LLIQCFSEKVTPAAGEITLYYTELACKTLAQYNDKSSVNFHEDELRYFSNESKEFIEAVLVAVLALVVFFLRQPS
jgi:hypothetical protein